MQLTYTQVRRIEGFVHTNKFQFFLDAIAKEAIIAQVYFNKKARSYYVVVESDELTQAFYDQLVTLNILIGYTIKEWR